MLRRLAATVALIAAAAPLHAAGIPSHDTWDALLSRHVVSVRDGATTEVDYAGFLRDRETLQGYLDTLAAVPADDFDAWAEADQLAFLINAYNAWTVELILTEYPGLGSIRDLGSLFSSPWKRRIAPLLGKKRTLDDIEHGMIRGSGRYDEPRIHFGVNCASIGCPALAADAYRGATLEQQLEAATRAFLGDRTRNRLEGGQLRVSSIFKWYREDFETGWRGADSLGRFLALYSDALALPADAADALRSGELEIDFLSYDWSLNDSG
ncbi:MAG: DUF547 domain-containing protein [Pseudomonadota bacterium]